jgi:hypothetical protein
MTIHMVIIGQSVQLSLIWFVFSAMALNRATMQLTETEAV